MTCHVVGPISLRNKMNLHTAETRAGASLTMSQHDWLRSLTPCAPHSR